MAADITESFVTVKATDYAILSDLAYLNWVKVGGRWIIAQNQPNRPKQYDYYRDKWQEMQSKGYTVVDFAPNDESGFSAVIFEKDGIHILAIRGTEFKPSGEKWKDFSADAYIHLGYMPPGQFESLVQYISDKGMYGFDVTGHSLGGFLAKVAKTLFPNSIGAVYTYNAPGPKGLVAYTSDGVVDENGKVTIQYTISTPMESTYTYSFKWDLATWYAYQLFLTNKDSVEANIHNIGGKDLLSSLAGLHTDIVREVFTASTNYGIAQAINDPQKHRYCIDPRRPISFIDSKESETIDGNYNIYRYTNKPIKDLNIEGAMATTASTAVTATIPSTGTSTVHWKQISKQGRKPVVIQEHRGMAGPMEERATMCSMGDVKKREKTFDNILQKMIIMRH